MDGEVRSHDAAGNTTSVQVENVEVVGFGGVVFLSSTTQVFGSDIATAMLADADGVPVRVTLCLDNHDQLFELELCKVDFSPIIGVDLRSASASTDAC
ncbi:hypothetical protein VM57_11525 [Stenotrophomonas maltophilia]|uniref:DUF6984 domain-containing protein n=1 Tax=Stenotrophomonas maltophilia TaxID=40324 RepID=A0A0F5ZN50_STEMA|nr:hypothetical protein VM57_11525 [Stenotrophomonas maltophilia]